MSTINKKQFKQYIEEFDFTGLFNQLGWSYLDEQTPVKLNEETYLFHSVAEKGGFRILVFKPAKYQDLPEYATRLQLDRKIGKLYREHLIIFCDKNNATQIWQLFVKHLGKPSRLSETRWHKGQEPELLYQKTSNLFFTLDQEENITIADVVDVVNANFSKNVEQVTKKFYENFRKEHKKFIEFIEGITVVTDREWYASLMLNRLMFCYFIQKKGFLDNNLNYLKEKLTYCQQIKGKDKFYVSFYKNFLLALFHQGLGSPDQSEELKKEIGKIPFLNGGLFDVHELERQYENIDISDNAFETIFHFFDQYNWHLDTKITASGKDINPDVIGFIFEKYINDRAQMGAYYTKEDITDYISKNCIIPFLTDETERNYPKAFKSEAEIWQMLKESGDTYIYEAVKKGGDLPLPKEIEIGIDTAKPNLFERRKDWNKTAPAEYALPTEIWREVVDRRKRYSEIREKIDKGEIIHINDFITYNLNIRQFLQDVIDNHSDPDFIRHLYEALRNITIIDPTCGSGAFLFAAMNILEPLYESCLQRMRAFIEDEDMSNIDNKKIFSHKYKYFRTVLEDIQNNNHPNLSYFIYKNIILRNLYGVDIMKEAVEIAKLRLFLKLVATVEVDYRKPNLGLEPLPDIDFNIRAGNTLVGFTAEKEIKIAFAGKIDFDNDIEKIKEECGLVSRAFQRFKEIQLKGYENKKEFTKAKTELNNRLDKLTDNLNKLLHKQHYAGFDYEKWLETHQPFHWFAEFYEIIHDKGGFEVVIGNPPYVEYSKVRKNYSIKNYSTESCGNLYAFVMEKMMNICHSDSFTSFIVPLAGVSTDRMMPLQKLLLAKNQFLISLFVESTSNPSQLFNGVKVQLVIHNYKKGLNKSFKNYSTNYLRFYSSERPYLFEKIDLTNLSFNSLNNRIPKVSSSIELKILNKINEKKKFLSSYFGTNHDSKIYYRRLGNFFFKLAFLNPPIYRVNNKNQLSSTVEITHVKEIPSEVFIGIVNSSLIYWYWVLFSNVMDFKLDLVSLLKFDYETLNIKQSKSLIKLCTSLLEDLDKNKLIGIENRKNGDYVEVGRYFPQKSKFIIDEIDKVLAEHYGFTEEELDFIINYDIKYRMGKELEEDV
jgi:hypothetical protein